ncbi:MAG TPA: thioredoxin [Patescibacteria group bacterium]|nr:thioredoxin [Patescibacteria group bacterium]
MASPHIKEVNEANFEDEVLKSDKLVLIDFYADWCGPCKALAPTLDKFADDNADKVKVVKINVDQNPNLAAAFGVQSIPTLVTMRGNQAIFGVMGNQPRKVLDQLLEQSLQIASGNNITPDAKDTPLAPPPAAPKGPVP